MSFSTDVLRCVGKYTWDKKITPVNGVTLIDNAVSLLNLDSGEATGADESAPTNVGVVEKPSMADKSAPTAGWDSMKAIQG